MPTALSAPSRLWQLGRARSAGRLGALVDRPSAPAGGHYAGGDLYDWARRTVEKVRVASVGGRLRFLPWVDTYTEETPEIRQEYRVMLRESSIKAAFQTKVLSVISEEVNVSPDDDDDPREQEGADFCRYALRKLDGGTRQAGWSVLHPAIIDGHSVCEKVWRQRPLSRGKFKGKRIINRLKAKDTRFLLLGIDSFRNLTALKGTGFNAGRVWSPSDFVVFSYFSLFENPAGMSDFRAAYRPYWVKHTAWQLRSLHLENFTGPFLVGRYGPVEQKAALESAFDEARANTWLTIPTSAMVETIDLSMRGTGDFKDAIADCDREILIAIVGAHLQILEGQTGGARGNTKVHKEIGELIQWWLAATLADVYQQQLVVPLMEENYHDVEPPLVTVGAVTDEDVLQRAKVYEALQKLGLKLSKKAVYRNVNVQPPDPNDRDDVLEPPGPGGQGAPGQPPPGGAGGGEGGGEGDSPFSEARRFCQEGENRGKPGPCPEGKGDGPGAPPPAGKARAGKMRVGIARAWLRSRGWTRRLSGEQKQAARDYVDNSGPVNKPLWEHPDDWRQSLAGKAKGDATALHDALEKAPTFLRPLTVWRGVQLFDREPAFVDACREALAGGHGLQMAGFLSTTFDAEVAENFSGNVVLEIEARKGAYLSGVGGREAGQSELLLQHNSVFEVAGIETATVAGEKKTVVRLRHRPGAEKSARVVRDVENVAGTKIVHAEAGGASERFAVTSLEGIRLVALVPAAPAGFSEADWAAFASASAAKAVGEKWQGPSGKWFTKRPDGRVVPTAAPAARTDAGKGKSTPVATPPPAAAVREKAFAAARAIAADPSAATPGQANAIGQAILAFNATDLAALKRELGLKGGGRSKPEMVEAIKAEARRAVAAAARKPPAATPAPPAGPGPPPPQPAAPPAAGTLGAVHAGLAASAGLSPKSRAAFSAAAGKVTSRMPAAVREHLDKAVGEVSFHESPGDLVRELALHPVLGGMFKNWSGRAGVQGQYFPSQSTRGKPAVAVARARGKAPNTGRYDDRAGNQDEGALAHELTHGLDVDFAHSNSPDWAKAFAAEIQPIDPKIKSGYRLSHYASTSRAEGFAEFGRLLYGSNAPPAKVEKDFPLASAYFKARGWWPGAPARASEGGADESLPVLGELFSERVALPGVAGAHADLEVRG